MIPFLDWFIIFSYFQGGWKHKNTTQALEGSCDMYSVILQPLAITD